MLTFPSHLEMSSPKSATLNVSSVELRVRLGHSTNLILKKLELCPSGFYHAMCVTAASLPWTVSFTL